MTAPDLSPEQEEVLLALDNEEAKSRPRSPVRVGTLAGLLNLSEKDCARIVRDLARLGLTLEHDAGPGNSILNAASLSDLGRKVAYDRALVEPKGPVDEFVGGLTPLQSRILNVVVEQESRVAGAAPTRAHVRTAIRSAAETPIAIEEVSTALDGLVGEFLTLLGGREPSYRVTVRGLLASKWGTNALEIVDGLLTALRSLHKEDPSLFRYSWSTARRALDLPRKAANLFYISVTQAGLGNGIFKSEGDDWWATPPELDVILEHASGLAYVRGVASAIDRSQASKAPGVAIAADESITKRFGELVERVIRLEAQLARPENPSVRIQEAFDRLDLHPAIGGACSKVFRDGYYRNAVLDAGIALEKYVQSKCGRSDLSGAGLMGKVFSAASPLLAFNARITQSERDEQEGLMHLFMGSMKGLRNPRAHGLDPDAPEVALEILCFVSFLARQLDRARQEPESAGTEGGATST